jgi:hypothetical protein
MYGKGPLISVVSDDSYAVLGSFKSYSTNRNFCGGKNLISATMLLALF